MTAFIGFFSEFFADLRAQKMRAFLTMFGIIWGTVTIIVLISFGLGFKKQAMINMHGMGESISVLFPNRTTKPYQGFGIGRQINLTEEAASIIQAKVRDIQSISPEYIGMSTPLRYGNNITSPGITGIYPIYEHMRNIIPAQGGRFIDTLDVAARRRVVVLGNQVKDYLFGDKDAIGKIVYVGQTPFTVVGVMQKKNQNSSYYMRDQDRIFIPAPTYTAMFGTPYITDIVYKASDASRTADVEREVREALGEKYKFDPADMDAMFIWNTTDMDKILLYITVGFTLFLGIIGSFTLGVAGLGVANIMFIVVNERVKEIGVKRAVGARKSTILLQFFAETFMIVGLGAAIGFLLGWGIVAALQLIPVKDYIGTPAISLPVVLSTMSILAAIGLSAGMMPARRAANLDVVECLRD
ncbi:MAG: ABC transporter permease [Bacteroidetes bacterium]|nr:ABC transporter permease [Bacteroidota bacterium]MCL5739222.1 ABC transporter permease [Bacteroidota bacterium]